MITATYDLTARSWSVTGEGDEIVVNIADGDADVFHPDNLRFGWIVTVNGEQADEVTHPAAGKFVEIRATARFHGRTGAAPDDQVTVTFSATEGDETVEAVHTFTMPRPEQPYPSWVWQDGGWMPPVPYPDGDTFYSWNEDTLTWMAVADELEA